MILRFLSREPYLPIWQAMQAFTRARTENTPDEIWLLEHEPVFTQGQNGRPEHLLHAGDTPLIQSDRGGQITWHGPGQLIAYTLVDLHRLKLNVRTTVSALEQAVIRLLAEYGIKGIARREAPGIYVDGQKICSIGLRIRRGCAYHGLALNLDPDLSPFQQIHPCGFADLKMTRLCDLTAGFDRPALEKRLAALLVEELSASSLSPRKKRFGEGSTEV